MCYMFSLRNQNVKHLNRSHTVQFAKINITYYNFRWIDGFQRFSVKYNNVICAEPRFVFILIPPYELIDRF